ncbi:paraneoplastic antigen Ma1-like [Chelonoidis abingdonii]|uniref:paraneoplastic antigen Ma1-like n=1 Tax=Chelonoidis abingdonii TaxID=106734 RepID=UPI0013F1F739|nr:paraneoplastic antigen Ma1-like [Chelonoidis abingdonii]
MNINPKNCLLVTGIPEAVDEGSIESILRAATECLNKCKMHRCMFMREEEAFPVLCELPVAVDLLQVPSEIAVEDGAWKLKAIGSQSPPASASNVEFLKKMSAFLGKEVKTLADMLGLLGFDPRAACLMSGQRLWGKTLEKVVQPHPESSPYCKLRLFSGGPTQIPREEGFEPWLEHTTEMLQEWAVPGAVKRRHLVECLRDQALDVIRTLTLSKPAVWVKVSFVALDHAFGRAEGSEDIYCKFLNATQRKGEKVSVYIQRFEKLLQRAIMRGALAVEQMDQTRLAQIVRGVQYQNPILLHL